MVFYKGTTRIIPSLQRCILANSKETSLQGKAYSVQEKFFSNFCRLSNPLNAVSAPVSVQEEDFPSTFLSDLENKDVKEKLCVPIFTTEKLLSSSSTFTTVKEVDFLGFSAKNLQENLSVTQWNERINIFFESCSHLEKNGSKKKQSEMQLKMFDYWRATKSQSQIQIESHSQSQSQGHAIYLPPSGEVEIMETSSVKKKRRLKMNKHKQKKLRRRERYRNK